MKVGVEKKENLEVVVTVEVPTETVDESVAERIVKVGKTAKIPGFRPGKVPNKVLMQRFGEAARQEVLSEVLRSSLMDALTQENLNPAGMPAIDIKQFESGKPLIFTATFEEYPEIDVKDLEGVEIEKISSTLSESDIKKVLENMRKQHAKWNDVDRAAKNEDQVVIDFEGFIDEKAFDGGKAEDVPLVLGSKSMIPGFEEGIVGSKAGDELNVKVKFPKEYQNGEVADKDAVFKIKVNKVQEAELPELDDKLAGSFGVKEGGIAKLREDVTKNMTRELENVITTRNKQFLIDALLAANEFKVPKALIDGEVNYLRDQMLKQFGGKIDEKNMPKLPDEMFTQEAKRRVTIGLLIGSVIKKDDIKADPERVKSLIKDAAKMYQNPKEVVDWYYQEKSRLNQFEMLAVENQVLDKLSEKAKIVKKELGYDEAMAVKSHN